MGKRLQTVAAVTCMKLLLMIFNVIFFVTGIVFLVVGIWMKVSLNHFLELSEGYNNAIAYVFIATGTAIVIVGSLGCWCTVKGQPILLYLFASFLILIFILQLGAGIYGYAFGNHFQQGFKLGLNNTIYNYGNKKLHDKDMDMLQTYFGCCGVEEYKDWSRVPWAKNSESLVVPNSCCKDKTHCENQDPLNPDDINQEGCYKKIMDFINKNLAIISAVAVGVAAFQLLGAILSCCLAKHINKAKYEPMK